MNGEAEIIYLSFHKNCIYSCTEELNSLEFFKTSDEERSKGDV